MGEGWQVEISLDCRMLAKISNSFKGSLGNLISDSYESENNLGSIREYSGSVVSVQPTAGREEMKRGKAKDLTRSLGLILKKILNGIFRQNQPFICFL